MNEPLLEKPAGLPARDMVLLCYILWAVGFLLPVLWLVYRVVKGWLEFSENRPMYRGQGSA